MGSWLPLVEQVIEQTERRVLKGETVPAAEKLVSLFEPHSDIIVKGGRDVHYGHKLNLTSGKSGMILDVVIEAGNPADAERLLPMLERHIDIYGRPPRQMAADGGYASGGNLKAAKEKGVRDMAFHKKRGLKIEDMVRSRWVYRKLRNFRAGIEAGISCLKRAYDLGALHLESACGQPWPTSSSGGFLQCQGPRSPSTSGGVAREVTTWRSDSRAFARHAAPQAGIETGTLLRPAQLDRARYNLVTGEQIAPGAGPCPDLAPDAHGNRLRLLSGKFGHLKSIACIPNLHPKPPELASPRCRFSK